MSAAVDLDFAFDFFAFDFDFDLGLDFDFDFDFALGFDFDPIAIPIPALTGQPSLHSQGRNAKTSSQMFSTAIKKAVNHDKDFSQ